MVPRLHVVRLESSSAHTKAALEIATLIRRRRLAPGARLGFHQAAAIGIPLSRDNAFLCQTDERFAVLALFVAHMVRTPPDDLWFPSHDKLRAARFTPGAPPSAVIALDGGQLRGLRDITPVLQEAPDSEFDSACDGVVRRAGATAGYEPESLSVAHDGSADMKSLLPRTVLDAVSPVEERLAEAARTILAAAPDLGERGLAAADQLEFNAREGTECRTQWSAIVDRSCGVLSIAATRSNRRALSEIPADQRLADRAFGRGQARPGTRCPAAGPSAGQGVVSGWPGAWPSALAMFRRLIVADLAVNWRA